MLCVKPMSRYKLRLLRAVEYPGTRMITSRHFYDHELRFVKRYFAVHITTVSAGGCACSCQARTSQARAEV